MDLTLLIAGVVLLGLIGFVTAVHTSGDEPSFLSQSGGAKKLYKTGKIIFLASLFLAVIFITNMF